MVYPSILCSFSDIVKENQSGSKKRMKTILSSIILYRLFDTISYQNGHFKIYTYALKKYGIFTKKYLMFFEPIIYLIITEKCRQRYCSSNTWWNYETNLVYKVYRTSLNSVTSLGSCDHSTHKNYWVLFFDGVIYYFFFFLQLNHKM